MKTYPEASGGSAVAPGGPVAVGAGSDGVPGAGEVGVPDRVGRGVGKLGSVGGTGFAVGLPPMLVSQPEVSVQAATSTTAPTAALAEMRTRFPLAPVGQGYA
jgi:hypothetical protein